MMMKLIMYFLLLYLAPVQHHSYKEKQSSLTHFRQVALLGKEQQESVWRLTMDVSTPSMPPLKCMLVLAQTLLAWHPFSPQTLSGTTSLARAL